MSTLIVPYDQAFAQIAANVYRTYRRCTNHDSNHLRHSVRRNLSLTIVDSNAFFVSYRDHVKAYPGNEHKRNPRVYISPLLQRNIPMTVASISDKIDSL